MKVHYHYCSSWKDPRLTWLKAYLKESEMRDITHYYVEVSNLTSLKVRHFSLMNVRSNVPFSIPSSFLPTSTFPKTSFSASGQREIFFVANSSTSCPNYSPIPRFSLLSPPFQRRRRTAIFCRFPGVIRTKKTWKTKNSSSSSTRRASSICIVSSASYSS